MVPRLVGCHNCHNGKKPEAQSPTRWCDCWTWRFASLSGTVAPCAFYKSCFYDFSRGQSSNVEVFSWYLQGFVALGWWSFFYFCTGRFSLPSVCLAMTWDCKKHERYCPTPPKPQAMTSPAPHFQKSCTTTGAKISTRFSHQRGHRPRIFAKALWLISGEPLSHASDWWRSGTSPWLPSGKHTTKKLGKIRSWKITMFNR